MDALVTDGDLVGAVAGLRGLAAAGVRAHVLATRRRAAGLLSRHAGLRLTGPDPCTDPAGFAARVAEVAAEHGPLVVYPSREESLDALFGADLPPEVVLPYASPAAVDALRDKAALPALAERVGLRTPRTVAEGTASTLAGADVACPVVVKPGRRGPGIPEVAIAHTDAELRAMLAACPPGLPVVLQEHVAGALGCVALVVDRDGTLVDGFQQRAGRIYPLEAGACTTAVSVAPDERLWAAGAQLLHGAGYWGLAQLDFIHAEDGPRLIDVNPRFYISLSLALAGGVNLPASWHAVATAGGATRSVRPYRIGVWYRRLESDFAAARHGRPGLLAARVPRPRVGAVWSRRDPLPGLVIAAGRVAGFGVSRRASSSGRSTAG